MIFSPVEIIYPNDYNWNREPIDGTPGLGPKRYVPVLGRIDKAIVPDWMKRLMEGYCESKRASEVKENQNSKIKMTDQN